MHDTRLRGQYFTPPEVVDLAFALLMRLMPSLAQGTLLDPSCGEGAFLLGALRAGLAPEQLYGLDTDVRLLGTWQALGLQESHLAVADGLTGGGETLFDAVVGNPPFAGPQAWEIGSPVEGRYDWCRLQRADGSPRALPREWWFLERSWRLCRPGGLIALVLPEGVLANQRWLVLRQRLLAACQVEAIIGLPRDTFRSGRTTVKTCLTILRKQVASATHQVRLAELSAEELDGAGPVLWDKWEAGVEVAAARPWDSPPS